MAVTLRDGEVVNSADATTGFNVGSISGDDDFVQGTGALGLKVSSGTQEIYTTSLGATAPYNYSSGGGEDGQHIIMWFNTKTPIAATGGLGIVVGNGTSRGIWHTDPIGFYKGGFITKVINTARDFNTISAGTWTTTGNPAQLTNITQMGGYFQTITSIMGSFNNVQLDQFTTGTGVRADAGTVGTPNTFETVRAADEDTNYWGWWSSTQGVVIGKGKLEIGPSSGTATSVFNDSAFTVIFAQELVASGFYEILTSGFGTNTDVTWTLGSISAANPSIARWSLTVDSSTNSFNDTNSVFTGSDIITMSANTTFTGTTIINGQSLIQNSGTLDGVTVLSANTADGVAYITANNIGLISDCTFDFSDGHAIELTSAHAASPTEYTFSGNTFTGSWGGTPGTNNTPNSGSTDAMIYNNSGKALIINITNGTNVTVRNGAGATTTINNNVSNTITVVDVDASPIQGAVVAVYTIVGDTQLANDETDVNGEITFSSSADTSIYVRARLSTTGSTRYIPVETPANTGSGLNLTITFIEDLIAL